MPRIDKTVLRDNRWWPAAATAMPQPRKPAFGCMRSAGLTQTAGPLPLRPARPTRSLRAGRQSRRCQPVFKKRPTEVLFGEAAVLIFRPPGAVGTSSSGPRPAGHCNK
jgi:hypothetical protein